MKVLTILITILFGHGLASKTLPELKKFINFGQFSEKNEPLNPEDICSFDNLKIWANFQSLQILPDHPAFGLKDGICRTIPNKGLSFFLTANPDTKRTLYLYLDMTTFKVLDGKKFLAHELWVMVNGKLKGKIKFQGKDTQINPATFPIYPEEFPDGRIEVTLTPNYTTTGRFWGIWDVFYSYEPNLN